MLHRTLPTLAAGVAAAALLAGCGGSSATTSSSAVGLQRVGVAAFATAVGQPGAVVLDVRTPAEFAAGQPVVS